MSEPVTNGEPTAAPAAARRSPRSPIDRVCVWGTIAVLGAVLAIELKSYLGYALAYRQLAPLLRAADDSENFVREADIVKAVGGRAPVASKPLTGLFRRADREDQYVWPGILKDRSLYVYFGAELRNPLVLWISSEPEPPPKRFPLELYFRKSPRADGDRPPTEPDAVVAPEEEAGKVVPAAGGGTEKT